MTTFLANFLENEKWKSHAVFVIWSLTQRLRPVSTSEVSNMPNGWRCLRTSRHHHRSHALMVRLPPTGRVHPIPNPPVFSVITAGWRSTPHSNWKNTEKDNFTRKWWKGSRGQEAKREGRLMTDLVASQEWCIVKSVIFVCQVHPSSNSTWVAQSTLSGCKDALLWMRHQTVQGPLPRPPLTNISNARISWRHNRTLIFIIIYQAKGESPKRQQ